jgi:NAD(P)-dependent dehydrogenase (short-subunit alcohol dehydrogenase family)
VGSTKIALRACEHRHRPVGVPIRYAPFAARGLVTGANRGLGWEFTVQLLERGAPKVYAAAHRPELVGVPGATPLRLDVTDPGSVAAAAEVAGDVTLLVNNAGIDTATNLVDGDMTNIEREIETHFYGPLRLIRALRMEQGAIRKVLSAMSWFSYDGHSAYSVGKAAAWSMTNGVRLELKGTQVPTPTWWPDSMAPRAIRRR